jgi:hypothetical protein
MLRLAMKAIPLRHDTEGLEILFEDDHLLALNKPPGVLTAPKHRYMVGLPRNPSTQRGRVIHGRILTRNHALVIAGSSIPGRTRYSVSQVFEVADVLLQGGSMVNRIIPYLGRMPHVLHRLDMFTSGMLLQQQHFIVLACISAYI